MRYFVTGATGFLGGELVKQLRAAGDEVVALVRTPAQAEALQRLGVTLAPGDITDRESLKAPMTGADGLFHCAAWYKIGLPDSTDAERINVDGTRNVLETMRELGVPRGIYTSTVAVFSDTEGRLVDEEFVHPASAGFLSEYDRTKWRAHYELAVPMARAGLPLVIVMPGAIYGPGDTSALRTLFVQYLQSKLAAVPARTAFCWAHVEDVARAHILAMERGRLGESYIVAGPAHSMIEALQIAERITGIKAPSLHPPPAVMKMASVLMGAVGALVTLPPELTAEGLRVLAGVTYFGSNAKARRELGYQPRSLEEGLRSTLAWEMRQLGLQIPNVPTSTLHS
jgi:nucleoside-diphosphate-sugar epimerase